MTTAIGTHIPASIPQPVTLSGTNVDTATARAHLKRRATAACSYCQWRKIRCNVEQDSPCSNCIAEKIDCRITKRRKPRKNDQVQAQRLPAPAVQPVAIQSNFAPNGHGTVQAREGGAGLPDFGTWDSQILLGETFPSAGPDVPSQHDPAPHPEVAVYTSPSNFSAHSSKEVSDQSMQPRNATRSLPSYFEAVPKHLEPEDVQYLQSKGAFDIPSDRFRDAVLASYAEFVHPYTPLLDIDEFLCDIKNLRGRGHKISLLVFQAVMFAGTSHVDIKPLRHMGFLTRKAARRALYQRTKALYHVEYERNRIHVIQSLVLMSLWLETPDCQQDSYHWLQIALSLARRAGLDQEPPTHLPEDERRVRRRLWWCLMLRDPLCALGLKRPVSILPHLYSVSELTLSDWDSATLTHDGIAAYRLNWNIEKLRLLRLACIAETKLHLCLSKIMTNQYRMSDCNNVRTNPDSTATQAILVPVTTNETWRSLSECEESLHSWREYLAPELFQNTTSEDVAESDFDAFTVFRSMLHMTYHTCIITLYRPWTRRTGFSQRSSPASIDLSFQAKIKTAIRQSAMDITNLTRQLHNADLARHLPQTGLSAMVAAVVSHISDLASGEAHLREPALRGFERCLHIINELRENYYSADFTSDLVTLLAQAQNLQPPPPLHATRSTAHSLQNPNLPAWRGDQTFAWNNQFFSQDEARPTESTAPAPNGGGNGDNGSIIAPTLVHNLPQALFPPGTDQTIHIDSSVLYNSNNNISNNNNNDDNNSGNDLALPVATQAWSSDTTMTANDLTGVNQSSSAAGAEIGSTDAAAWEYFRNFREESAKLLGNSFGDHHAEFFNSLLDINLGDGLTQR